jgi:hypothetical protein
MKTSLVTLLVISIIKVSVPMKIKVVESDTFSIHSTDKNVLYTLQNDSTIQLKYIGIPKDSINVVIKTPNPIRIETPRSLTINY